jgi:hypothetical protein
MALYVASQRVFIVESVYFSIDSVRKLLDKPSYVFFFTFAAYLNRYLYPHLAGCFLI